MNTLNILNWELFLEEFKQRDDMVDIFKISIRIGGELYNSWAVSSIKDEKTILPLIISQAKNKLLNPMYQHQGTSLQSSPDGYLYQYIQNLLKLEDRPGISPRELTSRVMSYFEPVEKINTQKITREEAERLKTKLSKEDPMSFRLKGSSFMSSPNVRTGVSQEDKKEMQSYVGGFRLTEKGYQEIKEFIDNDIIQLLSDDVILFYPKYVQQIYSSLQEIEYLYKTGPKKGIVISDKDIEKYQLELTPKAAFQLHRVFSDQERKLSDSKKYKWGLREISLMSDPLLFNTLSYVFKKYNIPPQNG